MKNRISTCVNFVECFRIMRIDIDRSTNAHNRTFDVSMRAE
jgi:hypothetical protein